MKQKMSGHLLALFCVIVWGSTLFKQKPYGSSNAGAAYAASFYFSLCCAVDYPPQMVFCWREEWRFLLMAIFGNTLYCWAEVTALTIAGINVSILVSTAPIITALILAALRKDERLTRKQALGLEWHSLA